MLNALFSFQGRLNRAPYWGYSLLLFALIFLPLFAILFAAALRLDGIPQAQIEATLQRDFIWLILGFTALSLWPTLALMAKRLQDHGKPGKLAMALIAPGMVYNVAGLLANAAGIIATDNPMLAVLGLLTVIVGLFNFVYLGCMRGTIGANAYGEDPVEAKAEMMAGTAQGA